MPSAVTVSTVKPNYVPRDSVQRLGLIALSTDLTSEGDARSILPNEGLSLHVARVAFDNPSTPENLAKLAPRLAAAADLLVPGLPLVAVFFSCTAATVEIGDPAIAAAVQAVRPGVPTVTPSGAAIEGFAAMGIRRIALVTPYLQRTTEPMAAYFERAGLDVRVAECLGVADDRDIARLTPDTILDAAMAANRDDVDGMFLSCTALPALGAIDELEQRLGKPVISSNQASYWRMLHFAGRKPVPSAPGRLFSVAPLGRAA